MKIVDFDKLSVLNLHYCQYTLDYFLDCMQELGSNGVQGVQTRLKRKDRFESK